MITANPLPPHGFRLVTRGMINLSRGLPRPTAPFLCIHFFYDISFPPMCPTLSPIFWGTLLLRVNYETDVPWCLVVYMKKSSHEV